MNLIYYAAKKQNNYVCPYSLMARNCEKHFVGLNRVFLNEQWKRDEERKRPSLNRLTTAEEVRKWIPSIKKDIDYYLRQLSGARKHDYPETKLKEFEEKIEQLEKDHKRFVNKVYQLDPDQKSKGIPWEAKAYVSKRKLQKETTSAAGSSNSSFPKKKKKGIVLNILNVEKNLEESKESAGGNESQ